MKKAFYYLAWFVCLLCVLAPAQSAWQSRDSGYNVSIGAAAGYTGPGDVVSGTTAFWGLRAYTATYAAAVGRLAEVCIPADATCANLNSDTNGNMVITAIGGSSCSVVVCTIKTLYDQVAANNCNSLTCDLIETTGANRPVLVPNCIGSLPCMTFNGTTQTMSTGNVLVSSQPNTQSLVANNTGTGAQSFPLTIPTYNTIDFNDGAAANLVGIFAGSGINAAATDGTWHALQGVYNGASSDINVNGTANTGNAGATGTNNGPILGGLTTAAGFFSGKIVEAGVWNGVAFSGGQSSSMSGNQRAYWGF